MKIMILKIIKHPIYNNNTYTYNSDTKSGLYKKKKKKKISLSLSERAKKKSHWIWESLIVFVQMGFFLSQKSWARIIPACGLNFSFRC